MGLPRLAAEALSDDRHGAARDQRRRQDVDHPRPARHLLHRRSRVQGQAARARRRRLRLFAQARGSIPISRRGGYAGHHRHPRRRARRGRRREPAGREVRLRPADRGPARARPLHAAAEAHRAELSAGRRPGSRSARSRAKSSRRRGGDIRTRAVGTGPYRLREWKRGSRIVLEANPDYRTLRFPESSDPALAALVRSMQGKTLPQIGVVEVSVIEEDLPRLLEFDRGRLDHHRAARRSREPARSPTASSSPNTRRAASRVSCLPSPTSSRSTSTSSIPVSAGWSNEHVALRRAIASRPRRRGARQGRLRRPGAPGQPDDPARRHRPRSRAAAEVAIRPRRGERAARSLRLRQARRRGLSARPGRQRR